ncbi:MAG: S46 family peptidase, partial [Flavobacteriaceae bacterium]|nr:S46 family peptidase [Flavobacteriaceae bacterium]
FNGGCTGEIISDRGLILTNHHCGYGAIQSHSTVEHDYLKEGFWAFNDAEELSNPGMYVTFIKRIDDITDAVFKDITSSMTVKEKQVKIDQNIAVVKKKAVKEKWQEVKIKGFYNGNQYLLFILENYTDIRMVGAPPTSIGKFGSDTDNWMWPRHTGDFSLFRIYADKNNRPAKFSKDNVPFKPKHFLPISLDGVAEEDFTLVFGFPGRTDEYLPAVAIEQIVKKVNPAKINIRENYLKIVDEYMRADDKIKIQYASKYASIANYWKKWIGENQGIEKSKAIAKKQRLESDFQNKVQSNSKYNHLLQGFNKLYKELDDVALARAYWTEVVYRNVELLRATFRLYQFEEKVTANPASFEAERKKLINSSKGNFKNYNAKVDRDVFEKLIEIYATKIPATYLSDKLKNVNYTDLTNTIYTKSKLTNPEDFNSLLTGTQEEVLSKLNADPAYVLGKSLSNDFYKKINPKFHEINLQIQDVQKVYMKALMEIFPKERFFPDANSTLRVTYGKVKGYYPKDGIYYKPVSYLKGVMEKYKPGDYEFDVDQKLIRLYNSKDFGVYGENGKMPVNFLGTNHTTGGNSGSPAIDAHGNLIGLNFDRVWEGTMSDYNYDPEICRNIMVDARYILFIIDKYAGNKRLINEMKLVHPKKKN